MVVATTVPLLSLAGSPYEVGLRHGRDRAAALREFLDDGLCRLDRLLPVPVSREDLAPRLDAYGEAITGATPDLGAELRGLAEGAGIGLKLRSTPSSTAPMLRSPARACRLRTSVLNSTRSAPNTSKACRSSRYFAHRLTPRPRKSRPSHDQPISSRRSGSDRLP